MAAIHTAFNIVATLIFLPYVKLFARFVERLVPARVAENAEPKFTFSIGNCYTFVRSD